MSIRDLFATLIGVVMLVIVLSIEMENYYMGMHFKENACKFDRNERIENLAEVRMDRCPVNTELVYLHGNEVHTVPDDSFLKYLSNLTSINLEHNMIKIIYPKAFSRNHQLNQLFLSENSLTDIDPNKFSNLGQLHHLDLSDNKLISVNKQFHSLHNLQILSLTKNNITTLDADAFINQVNLHRLDLRDNHIDELPSKVFRNLKSLQFLYLNQNLLSRLDNNSFVGLADLYYLNLDDNEIEEIDLGTFVNIPNLHFLYLGNNYLTTIPYLPLESLLELHLSSCSISDVKWNTFEALQKLDILRIDDNNIDFLHDFTFNNLISLTELHMGFNGLQSVGNHTFANLSNVVHLNLENNELDFENNVYSDEEESLQMNVFHPVYNLRNLSLSNNKIKEFRYMWFPETVTTLNLSHNQIAELSMQTISYAIAMKNIDLSYNLIEDIKEGSRMGNDHRRFPDKIERILLNNNKLSHIDKEAFKETPNLWQVVLNNNKLRHLELSPPTLRNADIDIIGLGLGLNPWLCDCNLLWLRDIIVINYDLDQSYHIQDPSAVICERLYHGDDDKNMELWSTDPYQDFMCTFSKNDSVWCNENDYKETEDCVEECPEHCMCYRDSNWQNIYVVCTAKNVTEIPLKIHSATSVLYLDGNWIRIIKATDFNQWFVSLEKVYLNNSRIEIIENGAFTHLSAVKKLQMQFNNLSYIPDDLFVNMTGLIELDLSENRLSNLNDHLFQPLELLETFSLHNNRLCTFPVWNLGKQLPHLKSVALYDNPWSCDCDYVALYTNYMKDNAQKLQKADRIYCMVDDDLESRIHFISFNESICFNGIINSGQVAILATSLCFLIALVILSAFLLVYRREIQVLMYSRYNVRLLNDMAKKDQGVTGMLYDAFVSYSSLDENFVAREFLPGLEGIENPYKLCLHRRDFPVGSFISQSIFNAVENSRRTILILSENFVKSEWCRFEFKTAHSQLMHDRRIRVIVIVLNGIPRHINSEMKLYFRTKTYLNWNDRLFWQKLYYAMPERNGMVVNNKNEN